MVGAALIGGDAVNGKAEGGHYFIWGYLNDTWAKGYKEVGQEVFNYSKWHGYSVLASWPFLMVAAFASQRLAARISALEGPMAAAKDND